MSNSPYHKKNENLPSLPPILTQSSINKIAMCHLQDIIQQYQSQPELLKLILTSKVEEDRRYTEEAKLRSKTLDMYSKIKQQQQQQQGQDEIIKDHNHYNHHPRHTPPLSPPPSLHPLIISSSPLPSPSSSSSSSQSTSLIRPIPILPCQPSTSENQITLAQSKKYQPRKRRSMQAVTKIIETKDPHYKDDYLWKNNGNTIQRKTGCKSTYYKCSNANKYCPVNKTILAKPDGIYIIKYRGTHLPICGKVEHVNDL
ncbi:hypothetical protein BJ944DRAFT_242769 [Cunninghamella echinulata]|nr:hypothetical protein BJ944DRAFT_242769 [Cunninghamella echinulata]